eukprot:373145-Lingulodinium_polyedra.AAC.1
MRSHGKTLVFATASHSSSQQVAKRKHLSAAVLAAVLADSLVQVGMGSSGVGSSAGAATTELEKAMGLLHSFKPK